jgi:septum formation protein
LNGKTHAVVTGVCLLHLRGHQESLLWESSAVTFHQLSPKRIRAYLDRIDTRDKAGAYAVQQHGEMLVERVTGSFTNVVGLPLQRLREELAAWS